MEVSPEDHYMLPLAKLNCLYLQWAERTKKVQNLVCPFFSPLALSLSLMQLLCTFHVQVAADSRALGLDKVFELIAEGENLPVKVEEDIRVISNFSLCFYHL